MKHNGRYDYRGVLIPLCQMLLRRKNLRDSEDEYILSLIIFYHKNLPCVGWPVQAAHKAPNSYDEKFLFASTTLDPVTPLANAYSMSKLFKGSQVVVVEGEGHCSPSSPNMCMNVTQPA